MDKQGEKTLQNPRKNSSILSEITFAWLVKIFVKGYHKELTEFDLPEPTDEHVSHSIGKKVEKSWFEEKVKYKKYGKIGPSLFRVLYKCFGNQLMFWGFVQFVVEIPVKTSKPYLVGKILNYYNGKSGMSLNEMCYWICGLTLNLVIYSFFQNYSWNKLQLLGIKIRVACSSLIYGKVLKLPRTSFEGETTVGQIINLLDNDVKCIDQILPFVHYVWISPIQTFIIAFLIYQKVGLSVVSGILIFFITVPFQGYLGKIVPHLSLKAASETDERLRLMNETISGVQVIKMFGWEKSFLSLIDQIREKEMRSITKTILVKFIAVSCNIFTSRISLFLSLLLCVVFENNLTAESVFILTMYYDTVQNNMNTLFPLGLQRGATWIVSMKRIQKFLMHRNRQNSYNDMTNKKQNDINNYNSGKNFCNPDINNCNSSINHYNSNSSLLRETILLKNASARWSSKSKEDTLKNINFSAKYGSFVVIVGQVGSGKTSLLQMILQELPLVKGSNRTVGKIAYVSQDPWIFSSSIRQNIIFTQPMDKERYEKVLKVCQLEKDFSLFPYKDQTIIGEKGINLSGGQRARIALARAVYADADIYLLDDPLSAVDSKVGRLIFNDCICNFLGKKTRILVTHQLQYVKNVDYIYVLNRGSVQEEGTYQDLQTRKISFKECHTIEEQDNNTKTLDSQFSLKNTTSHYQTEKLISDDQQEESAEHRTCGKVSSSVYFSYFKAAKNPCLVFLVFFLAIAQQLVSSGGDYYISLWAEAQQFCSNNTTIFSNMCGGSVQDNVPFILIYGGLTAMLIFVVYAQIFAYAKLCRKSSEEMHSSMFYSIVRGTMSFFYNNSKGRILNRFSKDISVIDKDLPISVNFMIRSWLQVIVVIGITISKNCWLLIPTICTGVALYFIADIYVRTSRSIKRLDGITQSPIIRHVTNTLQGLESVRAFGAQRLLSKEFEKHQDLHTSSLLLYIGCSQFLRLYIELAFEIYIGTVAYIFLFLDQKTSIADIGLIITQIIILADSFAWCIYCTTETETQMTCVERVLEYSKIEQESYLESSPDNRPPENWPKEGRVEFKNVYLRYHPEGTDVLRNINFVIHPKEKIGIVGRTGAGKSSLISAFFRLSHLEGEIYIDGVYTSNLRLHDLRSKISIIPQEPLLFAGTLRRNLDPFGEYSYEILWQALAEVELKTAIVDMVIGLESNVSDGGANFSMVQQQLLCLARAIIRDNRILVFDEATANEFDQPSLLLEIEHGFLYDMVLQTGSENVNKLLKMVQNKRL